MPELPEVETCRRGLEPHVLKQTITEVVIRHSRLRWPIPENLPTQLQGQKILAVNRRGKYLLFQLKRGQLLIHLGMSGRVRILDKDTPPTKHDHVDIIFGNKTCLRFNDTRRFGAILWVDGPLDEHPLFRHLGPEPLTSAFEAPALALALKKRTTAIKLCLMDNKVVTGVGNIYANEALFRAGINPHMPANLLKLPAIKKLVPLIKQILEEAIAAGGTTLKDFISADGSPGYFQQTLFVYGRGGKPCRICETSLIETRLGGRSTVHCPCCQK